MMLVFCCTLLGAAAQMLMKIGASGIPHPGFAATILAIFSNAPLFCGYCLYGLSTALLVLALRHGELSMLYPVIALTYVWVTILSVLYFHESMNFFKVLGLITVVAGVTVLGSGKKQ